MPPLPSIDNATLEAICGVLGDTAGGLTGSEIGRLLSAQGIADPLPTATKRHRLFEALRARQEEDRCANNVIGFIQTAMNPVGYTGAQNFFEERRGALNEVLAFGGYELGEDGRVARTEPAATLTEAQRRARSLLRKLTERGVHGEVLRFCRAELLEDNYFHAVLEATKGVAERIRGLTGLTSDGEQLVDAAFGGDEPLLAINSLETKTEHSEQKGFANLLRGMFGTFRNPGAHVPRIYWPVTEADALDLLSLASYFHRRLDRAVAPQRL